MPRKAYKIAVVVAVLATLVSGCRSADEYKKLAIAGTKYADAVDQLLQTASDIKINSTSEQLLLNDEILNQSVSDYEKLSKLDVKRLEIIAYLRTHNRLLTDYFKALQGVASSNAPKEAQREIGGIVDNLNTVGNRLRGSDLISNKGGLQAVTGLVISSQIRGALRKELELRSKTIMLELATQQEMLNVLSVSIEQDMKIIKLGQEQRLIINPLIQENPISDKGDWIEKRRNILRMEANASQLQEASGAMAEFQDVFKDFVEGKSSDGQISVLLTDIENLLTVVEALK